MHSLPLLYEELADLLGDRGSSGSTGRVEARHDPGHAPELKELTEASASDAPAGGHLGEGIAIPLILCLPDKVRNVGVG